jgi:small-conductance mechanosensitive channel
MILFSIPVFVVLLALRFWGIGMAASHLDGAGIDALTRGLNVALVVAGGFIVDGLVRYFYWHRYWTKHRNRETPALIRDLLTIAIVLLTLSLGLWWQEGVSFAGLITASGATAIILGIALQTVIQDLFSGLSVNLEGSYAIGDWLTVYSEHLHEPAYGRVTGITWRSTFLELEDGCRLMVPNHIATSNAVLNHSRPHQPKMLFVEVGISTRMDCESASNILLGEAIKAVHHHGMAKTPAPSVIINHMTSDAIFYHVRFYSDPHIIHPLVARSLMFRHVIGIMQEDALPIPQTYIQITPHGSPPPPTLEAQVREGLRHADLFQSVLDEDQKGFVASRSRVVRFKTGAALMRQGDQASSMFIILEGAAHVTIDVPGEAPREVAVLATGDIVGEMSLMTGAPRSATVSALTMVKALEITKEPIAELLQASPELLQGFSDVLARRQAELHAVAHRSAEKSPDANSLLARMRAFFSLVRG